MASITKATRRHDTVITLLVTVFAIFLMIALTGCGFNSAVASDPNASAASEEPAENPTPPEVDQFLKSFGEVVTYQDGVSISVAIAGEFTPTNLDYMPLGEGETGMAFKVVLTNNSETVFEPGAMAQANSGGKPATYIADVGNPEFGDLGLFPTTSILPGQTLEWFVAFGVVDPLDITLDISPAPFGYDTAIFTNVAF